MIWSLTGFMGCGKSSVGKVLAYRLSIPFIDLDQAIEKIEGRSIPEIFSSDGETGFRAVELKILKTVLASAPDSGMVLALGGGTITTPEARELVLSNTTCIYLKASENTLKENIGSLTAKRPLLKTCNFEELLKSRIPLYEQAGLTLETDGKDVERMVSELIQIISSRS